MFALQPIDLERIDDAWLTAALRQGGMLDESRVVTHTLGPVARQGATAVVARIAPLYDPADSGPRFIIGKFASPHRPMRTMLHNLGLYEREIRFYREFGQDPGIPIPACYYAEIEPDSGTFTLLSAGAHPPIRPRPLRRSAVPASANRSWSGRRGPRVAALPLRTGRRRFALRAAGHPRRIQRGSPAPGSRGD